MAVLITCYSLSRIRYLYRQQRVCDGGREERRQQRVCERGREERRQQRVCEREGGGIESEQEMRRFQTKEENHKIWYLIRTRIKIMPPAQDLAGILILVLSP
jgi:hypothetical protein